MDEQFIPLGMQEPKEIARKLREIEDDEAAQFYEQSSAASLEESLHRPRKWLNAAHQYGFIPIFTPGAQHRHDIISASNMRADETLRNQRINIRLHRLHVYEYPMAFTPALSQFFLGTNVHTILLTFEARNQVDKGTENVAFNQVYEVPPGQDVGVAGAPIFLGLKVGNNGVFFTCKTVNIGSSNDQKLASALGSGVVKTGLHLLTTAQPGIAPFVDIARGLAISFANSSKNIGVQSANLGLDFDTGAPDARLAIGTYIVAQVPHATAITWQEWCYDANTDTVVHKNRVEEGKAYTLPYNTIMFRVGLYQEENV